MNERGPQQTCSRRSSVARFSRACAFGLMALAVGPMLWAADLVVSNVRARQLPGSGHVEVLYDLSGAPAQGATVSVVFSSDGGASWVIAPAAAALSGQVGPGVRNGLNRQLVWDAATTLGAGAYGAGYRARVTAVDPDWTPTTTPTATRTPTRTRTATPRPPTPTSTPTP